MKYLGRLLIMTALMFLVVNSTKAQSNPVVTMQGFLTDSTGRAFPDGTYASKFRIYDDPTGGTLLWEESHNLILDHGLYDAFLGAINPIDLPFDMDYWLSVEVVGVALQQPRLRVGHSFVSLKALKSDSSRFAENADSLAGIAASAYALKSDIPTGGNGGEVVDGAFSTTSNVTSNVPGNLALDDFVFGSSQLNDDGIVDHNRRMFFDKSKGAFRAGFSNGDEWNDSNVGEFSTAFGWNTKASGNWSTAFGRDTEASGNWSIAIGRNAIADANNSIVMGSYADANNKEGVILLADASTTTELTADKMNEFKVRAAGGTTIYSNSQMTSGVMLSSGGGAWMTVSDSTAKRNIRNVNTEDILDKVMNLPIKQWNYRSQAEEIEHIGPMAQDFYSIFNIGENDLTISTIDPSGVALAAIQELYKSQKELELKTEELGEMKKEIKELRELLNRIVGISAK